MPWSLQRFQHSGSLHFVTFSCYQRLPKLGSPENRDMFEQELERVRRWYGFVVSGYVVMPEHVHLLVSEPKRKTLAIALQMLKQGVSQKLGSAGDKSFWQRRYYDFNVRSQEKLIEKLKYMHRNPVRRGLVQRPEDWPWSSFLHHATGIERVVEVESRWTARKREKLGHLPQVKRGEKPHPLAAREG